VAKLSAREVALVALRAWRQKKDFADAIITDCLASTNLDARDKAFALELFYGVLRNLTRLDFWIGCLRTRRLDARVRDLLRLGLYQLLSLSLPDHAAIYETVAIGPKRNRPVVNAVLRSASRQQGELLKKANAQPLHIQTSHPRFLIDRWRKRFGLSNTEALCAWNNRPPPIYARVNKLKIDVDSFLRKHPTAQRLANMPNCFELGAVPLDSLKRGECYLQDPSTAIACELVIPKAGERVLDACAAPGGKTGYLAEIMQNRGLIVACDRDRDRIRLLEENLNRLGVTNAKVLRHDWTEHQVSAAIRDQAPFDRILIDAPCSNTGVMRRRVDVRWRLTEADFERMHKRQLAIARNLEPLLKAGGIMVYSTCSLEVEENEEVVQELLKSMSALRLEQQKQCLPFRDGLDGAFAVKLIKMG
jgi:16S rRNA (cytosine967-C5)-methyltransferase